MAIAIRKAAAMAFSPLNADYSPLNAVTVALPLNVLAGDLKPWFRARDSPFV